MSTYSASVKTCFLKKITRTRYHVLYKSFSKEQELRTTINTKNYLMIVYVEYLKYKYRLTQYRIS